MGGIPECYDPPVQMAEREAHLNSTAVRCACCDEIICTEVYVWDGGDLCEECCRDAVRNSFCFSDIAEALQISIKAPWEVDGQNDV